MKGEGEVVGWIKKKKKKTEGKLYKIEALSKAADKRKYTHARTHERQPGRRQSVVFVDNTQEVGDTRLPLLISLLLSARVHAEELDALRAPVQADPGVEHQRPHVRDEEVLWLVLLHVFELELWEFLFNADAGVRKFARLPGYKRENCNNCS